MNAPAGASVPRLRAALRLARAVVEVVRVILFAPFLIAAMRHAMRGGWGH